MIAAFRSAPPPVDYAVEMAVVLTVKRVISPALLACATHLPPNHSLVALVALLQKSHGQVSETSYKQAYRQYQDLSLAGYFSVSVLSSALVTQRERLLALRPDRAVGPLGDRLLDAVSTDSKYASFVDSLRLLGTFDHPLVLHRLLEKELTLAARAPSIDPSALGALSPTKGRPRPGRGSGSPAAPTTAPAGTPALLLVLLPPLRELTSALITSALPVHPPASSVERSSTLKVTALHRSKLRWAALLSRVAADAARRVAAPQLSDHVA